MGGSAMGGMISTAVIAGRIGMGEELHTLPDRIADGRVQYSVECRTSTRA